MISKKSKKNIRLNIIGAGPLLQDIQDLIINLKLEDTVFLLGEKTKEEVFGEMRSSDIFALISKHEGLPITILEAMAAGLPVVASKVGGIPEEIDASCGLLVKSNTPQEIAEKLMFLIEDEEKRESLGRSAHERAKKLFSVEKFLEETKEVYKNLLND